MSWAGLQCLLRLNLRCLIGHLEMRAHSYLPSLEDVIIAAPKTSHTEPNQYRRNYKNCINSRISDIKVGHCLGLDKHVVWFLPIHWS